MPPLTITRGGTTAAVCSRCRQPRNLRIRRDGCDQAVPNRVRAGREHDRCGRRRSLGGRRYGGITVTTITAACRLIKSARRAGLPSCVSVYFLAFFSSWASWLHEIGMAPITPVRWTARPPSWIGSSPPVKTIGIAEVAAWAAARARSLHATIRAGCLPL
jgi:hypothetical protein